MLKPKIILGIESSCDETAAAVVQKQGDRVTILSNIVASSASLQAKFGGVIPEQAAREQLKSIIPVIKEALSQAFPLHPKPYTLVDSIAVTQGPGLIGSLLVGVETAKTLATVWQKPLIPINHLLGHFYANWINYSSSPLRSNNNNYSSTKQSARRSTLTPQFPCIGLLVSGGHTDLVLFTDHGKYQYLGGTRDDAAGECFDKCARLLNLSYPGGPNLALLAKKGNPKAYSLPRPMIDSKDFDFSFSGLKTAVLNITSAGDSKRGAPLTAHNEVMTSNGAARWQDPQNNANLAASIEDAITDVLVNKTVRALQTYRIDQLIVAGGVAANEILAQKLTHNISEFAPRAQIFIPPPLFCTDNAVSIATAAFFNFYPVDPLKLQANPNLSLSHLELDLS